MSVSAPPAARFGTCVVSNYCSRFGVLGAAGNGRCRVKSGDGGANSLTPPSPDWVLGHRDDRSGPPATPNRNTKHRVLLVPGLVEHFFRVPIRY